LSIYPSAQIQALPELHTFTERYLHYQIKEFRIPLPDLSIQKDIVAEIEQEKELVQANHQLITRFEQKVRDRVARVWGEA
jgi:restriction endonuclease S subunit